VTLDDELIDAALAAALNEAKLPQLDQACEQTRAAATAARPSQSSCR